MNIKEVAADLRYCRRESGLSGTDVSHLLHITKSRLSRLETGKSEPRPSELCAFSLIYRKNLCALLPELSGRIAFEMHKRFEHIPEEPTNWKARDLRDQFLASLYQRLNEITEGYA